MALWYVPNQGIVDDQEEGAHLPEYGFYDTPQGRIEWGVQGIERLPEYRNPAHYGDSAFSWDPARQVWSGGIEQSATGYIPMLLDFQDLVRSGQAKDYEAEQYRNWEQAARAIPTRAISTLRAGWQPQRDDDTVYEAGETAYRPSQEWWSTLDPMSPDVGPIVLQLREKLDAGTATPQERQLYEGVVSMARDLDYRASVPQASDAFNPLGDQFFGALGTLALGATGGLAAAPLFAGGAGLATTLGSLGTLAGVAGTGAGVIGQATDQDWLSNLGLGLGIAGGLAGGLGGLSNLWGSGVNSLTDAAKLASSAGKITGSLGRIPGAGPLKDVSRYLGYAGQAGNLGASLGADDWLGWSGSNAPLAGNVAPGVQNLLSAADHATQRGGGGMADFSYEDFIGWGEPNQGDPWNFPMPADTPGWEDFTSWGDPYGPGSSGDMGFSGEGSGGWLGGVGSVLGSIGGFLGKSGILGPAASALGSLGGGAIGSNAANEAARLQAAALNRGIDLSTSQWLEQLARTQPWVQAGQQALGTLQGLAGQQLPGLPGATPGISGANYAMPGTTPGWSPNLYQGPQGPNAGDYRWTPQAGPQAAGFRYTPGAVPTLSGRELLANDPGYQFRMDESRKALEGSAAARGDLLSGQNLKALQSRSQDLASQEYGNAWNRASQQAQLREQWNQMASQMGWSQAESEARFREQMAQQSGAQNWQQALQGQQNQFNQGLDTSKWNTLQQQQYAQEQYKNMLEQSKLRYGMDVTENTTNYDRAQQLYRQQLAQHLLPWEQNSTLAQLGGQITGQLGGQGVQATSGIANLLSQLGTAQGTGAAGQGLAWTRALGGATNQLPSILAGLNA